MSKNIIFIGDSLTEFFDWQKRFPSHNVLNLGIAGETVEGLLNRMDRIILRVHNPDFIFIMTGINNIAMEDYEIIHAYKQILIRLFSSFSKSKIVVQSILPVILPWIDNNAIRKINDSLQDLGKNFTADYLDIYSLFSDSEGNPDSSCLLEDSVHLSDKGYEVWSKAVENFLKADCRLLSGPAFIVNQNS